MYSRALSVKFTANLLSSISLQAVPTVIVFIFQSLSSSNVFLLLQVFKLVLPVSVTQSLKVSVHLFASPSFHSPQSLLGARGERGAQFSSVDCTTSLGTSKPIMARGPVSVQRGLLILISHGGTSYLHASRRDLFSREGFKLLEDFGGRGWRQFLSTNK